MNYAICIMAWWNEWNLKGWCWHLTVARSLDLQLHNHMYTHIATAWQVAFIKKLNNNLRLGNACTDHMWSVLEGKSVRSDHWFSRQMQSRYVWVTISFHNHQSRHTSLALQCHMKIAISDNIIWNFSANLLGVEYACDTCLQQITCDITSTWLATFLETGSMSLNLCLTDICLTRFTVTWRPAWEMICDICVTQPGASAVARSMSSK